jgi:cystathionine beta-lyase
MAARLVQHRACAEQLIDWLRAQPEVDRVLYPPLPDDPGHVLWKRDMTGASGLFGVVLKPMAERGMHALLDGLELFGMGGSWGGFESLVFPSTPERTVVPLPFAGPLFRIAAGLEDVADLIDDLRAGFERMRAVRGSGA